MTCGLAISPRANSNATTAIASIRGWRTYQRYAPSASRKNNMLSRFLRSAIQATDLDIDGMQRKQRSHHEAAARVTGRPL